MSKKENEGKKQPQISEDEVLRRMLNTPPKPHKDEAKRKEKEAPRK